MEITYHWEGDYQIPDITMPPVPEEATSRYGMMRRCHLERHRKVQYSTLILTGELWEHLAEVSRTAEARMERMMEEFVRRDPPPDKATDQMGWVAHMNSLRHQAEEIILAELIYS
ncbi:MAG: TnpV protein [Acidobacteriota bacterium]|jgi:hypothetical protein|nr:TnpV protein [Acidobacteriota bacterium]